MRLPQADLLIKQIKCVASLHVRFNFGELDMQICIAAPQRTPLPALSPE